jgi:hypothetical protein
LTLTQSSATVSQTPDAANGCLVACDCVDPGVDTLCYADSKEAVMGLFRALDETAALCVASDELNRGPFSAPHRRLSQSLTATSDRNNLWETSFSPLDFHLSWMSLYLWRPPISAQPLVLYVPCSQYTIIAPSKSTEIGVASPYFNAAQTMAQGRCARPYLATKDVLGRSNRSRPISPAIGREDTSHVWRDIKCGCSTLNSAPPTKPATKRGGRKRGSTGTE